MHNQVDFWQRVIGLTTKTTRYPSPFRNVSYSWHIIEPEISSEYLDDSGNDKCPDLVSSKWNNWIVSDLTLNPDKNWKEFKKFSTLPPETLADIGSPKFQKNMPSPDILIIGSSKSIDKHKCNKSNISGLIVMPSAKFYRQKSSFKDDKLSKELEKIDGKSLKNPPTKILAVPEIDGFELRKALKSVLLSYAFSNEKFHPYDLVEDLLMDEIGLFSHSSRKTFSDKVRKCLIRLSDELRKMTDEQWIKYNQQTSHFRITKDVSKYSSRKKFEKLLDKWCTSDQIQERLEDFD